VKNHSSIISVWCSILANKLQKCWFPAPDLPLVNLCPARIIHYAIASAMQEKWVYFDQIIF